MKSKASPSCPAIKGYLPLRVALPPIDASHSFRTFLYVKEHAQKSPGGSGGGGATLFVANAPARGPIRTDLFLRALFEQYGEVHRVTVAGDPRKVGSSPEGDGVGEMFREAAARGLEGGDLFGNTTRGARGDGKFAHVVFASGKELKKALKAIKKEMAEAEGLFAMQLDEGRIEELEAETIQLRTADASPESDDEGGSRDVDEETAEPLTGIHAVAAEARRKAGRHRSRQSLMDMCNRAMAAFEDEEAEAERKAKRAAAQPDADGFVTVSHKSTPSFGAANDLEEERHHRRKAGKRNRKRKGGSGADEHTDFYRFQRKETRKREVQDLKQRFEEDLAKVRKMKEERAYRPF
ncbi:hypothetical protein ACHAXT_004152 [Thalassiosira profunda]